MMQANENSSRAAALARRKAMSSGGKSALSNNTDRTRSAPERAMAAKVSQAEAAPAATPTAQPASSTATSYRPRVVANPVTNSSRAASLARRKAMSNQGKTAAMSKDRTRDQSMVASNTKTVVADKPKAEAKGDCGCGCDGKDSEDSRQDTAVAPSRAASKTRAKRSARPKIVANPSKAAALARRKAQSTRGKAGISAGGMSEAQTARAANPTLTSRELSQALRQQRSAKGKTCKGDKCRPTGKVRKQPEVAAATDQPWKVGVSETARGQSVTGTMVSRDKDVTGNEASTCRPVTGTEYMGADVFREFCDSDPAKTPMRTGISATGRGNAVTGNKVGRSGKVTGDEPGTCKNVTGTEYVGAGQSEVFCGTSSKHSPTVMPTEETRKGKTITGDNVGNSDKVTGGEAGANRELTGAQYVRGEQVREIPSKVRTSKTLHGGSITGTAVGRSEKTTGDEAGSSRQITGDDYVGLEQYENSGTQVKPGDRKVGVSSTFKGLAVTGTMEGRSQSVTGNEPGTCKAVTGTPYFGAENYADNCEVPSTQNATARMQRKNRNAGMNMTGQQPGVGGTLTGADKGACEAVTGTPYMGSDQMAQACPATPAEPGSADFPQAVGDSNGWGEFSVTTPSHAAAAEDNTGVTGSRYEQGHITGPFGMAGGKVTGTEDARFGSGSVNSTSANEVAAEPEQIQGRVKSRITGEGQDSGLRITGDDWERGEHVTGTEGASALARNPSRRGPMNAMMNKVIDEVENELPSPVSKVTGSSGNYEGGSLITYSGGARG
ncbi:MAG: CsoS2 family carboxysome shell protein [Gammaproteobacteria bacterium]|nr:CsoS2 family carboxysome shell protein [Gammaproteobacteria bacterium]